MRRRAPKPPVYAKTRPTIEKCPICGRKLYEGYVSRRKIRSYQQTTIIERTIDMACPNQKCRAHIKWVKPGFRRAPPNAKYEWKVIADIVAMRKQGLTAGEILERLSQKGLKRIAQGTIRSIANKFMRRQNPEEKLEQIRDVPVPILAVQTIQETELQAKILNVTECYSGETIYRGAPKTQPKKP